MSQTKAYFGGVPTDIELRKLRDHFTDDYFKEGAIITYREVENVIGVSYGSSRFNAITKRWRDVIQRELGMIIDPDPENLGKQYKVLSDEEKLTKAEKGIKSIGKKTNKILRVLGITDRTKLSDQARRNYDFRINQTASMRGLYLLKKKSELPTGYEK